MVNALHMTATDIRAACHAWDVGGCLALGLWLGKKRPRFSVRDYADLVALVRAELDDTTDYSKE